MEEPFRGKVGDLRGKVEHLRGMAEHFFGKVEHLRGKVGDFFGMAEHFFGKVEHLRGKVEHFFGNVRASQPNPRPCRHINRPFFRTGRPQRTAGRCYHALADLRTAGLVLSQRRDKKIC